MTFPAYPEYKDSGIGWLGKLPSHWEEVRLKNLLAQRITDGPHLTPIFISEGVPFLSVDGIQNGELIFESCRYVSMDDHTEFCKKAKPQKDDILMGKAASTGKIARVKVDFEFSIWSPLALIRIQQSSALPAFVEYALLSPRSQAEIDTLCTSNTQKNISMDDIPRLTLTKPPLDEQRLIVKFLDHETTKIDALIQEQEKIIELLKEKRQAIISNAVCRGLDPNVPMKDSGVKWLGMIPQHYKLTRLGRITSAINDINHEMPEPVAEGIPFLSAKDLDDYGNLNFDNEVKLISEADYQRLSQKICPEKGDIIYSRYGTVGRAAVVKTDKKFLVSYSCCVIKINHSDVNLDYLRDLLSSDLILTESRMRIRSMGQPDLGLAEIRRFPIPLPPIEDQISINRFLKNKLKEIDELMSEAFKASQFLHERRLALISAAVTGQIDVRNPGTQNNAV
jgi:type I restriction enzyme S subunit